uniref:Leishmanolysin-like peptidase n=1 Tax=Chaetoceros debilis TaxID=122233 RepID=A0A7S3V3W3_9STRA|mmetsp:Transcript_5806/g.8161  ORF Transcript_5806/g.8161 Transcript_5806/m.8161 type:complete len:728 (+) Transcript_5806:429-2612(+)
MKRQYGQIAVVSLLVSTVLQNASANGDDAAGIRGRGGKTHQFSPMLDVDQSRNDEQWQEIMRHKRKDNGDFIRIGELASIHRSMMQEDDLHLSVEYSDHPHERGKDIDDGFIFRSLKDDRSTVNNEALSATPSAAPSVAPSVTIAKPIRIAFETTELDINASSQADSAIADLIKNTVLPEIKDTWSSLLSVSPVVENIPIPAGACNGFLPNIPSNFIENGIGDSDLVIFVSGASSVNGKVLCEQSSLAGASFCYLDQIDRPIIGFINFCLSNLRINDVEQIINVGVHEVAHILGFNDDLFKYFRDFDTGNPLTPRPFKETVVDCVDGTRRKVELASSKTLKKIEGKDENGDHLHYEIITPSVQQVVRNQFNCPSLEGARLENQPTKSSCTGGHWDERLFFTETMGPILSSKSAALLSPLTVALLEDSGFYTVNYTSPYVENSPFGLGSGCDFVNGSCIDKSKNEVPEAFKGYFCDSVTKIGDDGKIDSSSDSTCDPTFSSIAYCDLFDFSKRIPDDFPTPDAERKSYFSDQNLGVLFTEADYCPTPVLTTVECSNSKSNPSQRFYPGEIYGKDSKCVFTEYSHPKDGIIRKGACFPTKCNHHNHTATVYVDGENIPCTYDGERHDFPLTTSAVFECPPLRSICPNLFCPAMCSGNGICDYESNPPKCICEDETDDTDGCYGVDFHYFSDKKHLPALSIKDPNSSSSLTLNEYIGIGSALISIFLGFI